MSYYYLQVIVPMVIIGLVVGCIKIGFRSRTPQIVPIIARRRRLKFDFDVLNKRYISEDETCSICLSSLVDLEMNDKVYRTNCNHMYHKQCIDGWIRSNNQLSFNCPLCLNTL